MSEKLEKNRSLVIPLLLCYFGVIAYTAWVSDDAIITFRSIQNWFSGYGLVFNIGERVQTFTHPLWFFLQSILYILTRILPSPFNLNKLFYGNIVLCLSISLITIALYAFKIARSTQSAIIGILILILSKSFIDYSTSGLENPLSHFLALLFFGLFLRKEKQGSRYTMSLSFIAGLAILNRVDIILIFLPALITVIWQSSNKLKTTFSLFIGMLPVLLWELFSLFYYGFPFPNTAIAKLNTGIDTFVLFRHGAYYLQNSLRLDTITLVAILVSIVTAVFSRSIKKISAAIGVTLYLSYVLYIGGDFMSGRFFSLPLFIGVILLSTYELKSLTKFGVSVMIVLGIGLLPFITTIERRPTYGKNRENNLVFIDKHKIADERLVYRDRTGLLIAIQGNSPRVIYSQEERKYTAGYPKEVHLVGAMGLNGLRGGPNTHVIDKNGLADPLIARMPLVDRENFRIGHFHHIIPDGYKETLSSGINVIQDDNIAIYYDNLSYVIKGPLWDWNRVIDIWNLNTRKYDHLIKN